MQKLTQIQKIVTFLQTNPNEKFNARQIAEKIVETYPEDYADKKLNPRFENDKLFISQIVAEIGSQKNYLTKNNQHILWQDKPRPRVFWHSTEDSQNGKEKEELAKKSSGSDTAPSNSSYSEHDLYPILITYLKDELNLYCQRIDEKRSKNSRGIGGNKWLHPDIVAMETVGKEWNELIKNCVKQGPEQSVRLWSFEVKIKLNNSNVRESFFQTVSNSSWANESYLVATSIQGVEQELKMLSALHGVGVILLDKENPTESDIVFPSKSRTEIDWQSVNRILVENPDFKDYIELVSDYHQTGRVKSKYWN